MALVLSVSGDSVPTSWPILFSERGESHFSLPALSSKVTLDICLLTYLAGKASKLAISKR